MKQISQSLLYAHTLPDCGEEMWEPLYGIDGHAERVAQLCAAFCADLSRTDESSFSRLGFLMGYYHDMGKASDEFQQYLKKSASGKSARSVDHKTAAAAFIQKSPSFLSHLLPYVFYGHHSGLPSGTSFYKDKLSQYQLDSHLVESLPDELQQAPLETLNVNLTQGCTTMQEVLFALSFAIRMLHSCLIDADWLATEAFMEKKKARARLLKPYESLSNLSECLENYLNGLAKGELTPINMLRKEIHEACYRAAAKEQGVYRLNVPTGGGKTLSSLSFALRHAVKHELKRVIYVIPYTSIIEQTAKEFRKVLGDDQVLEHHSNISDEFDTEANRFAAENWDAPVIVTSSVQFFESLFSNQNSRCRKVHSMAQSVIIFDEAQMLPCDYLAPCLAAMKCLNRIYGASLVLCTATQPALENRKGFEIGWQPKEVRSLIGEDFEVRLAQQMKRVEIFILGKQSQEDLLQHFSEIQEDSALFIMNLTRQAQDFYQRLERSFSDGRLFHLSARMCPEHRSDQIEMIKQRLEQGAPTILVATRVVEAGVDLSFPLVYRDRCGLDSLAQSAGRCNRHGELPIGETYSFEAAEPEYALPKMFADSIDGANTLFDIRDTMPETDLLSPSLVNLYFCEFYSRRGRVNKTWDIKNILIEKIGEFRNGDSIDDIDFKEIGKEFQFIPQGQRSLMVPFGEKSESLREELLKRQAMGLMPTRAQFREVARLSVNVYSYQWERLATQIELLHETAGIYMLSSTSSYHEHLGLMQEANDTNYIL